MLILVYAFLPRRAEISAWMARRLTSRHPTSRERLFSKFMLQRAHPAGIVPTKRLLSTPLGRRMACNTPLSPIPMHNSTSQVSLLKAASFLARSLPTPAEAWVIANDVLLCLRRRRYLRVTRSVEPSSGQLSADLRGKGRPRRPSATLGRGK